MICYFSFTCDCWWRHPLKQVILWWLLPQSRQHSHRNLSPAKAAVTYGPVTVSSTTESGTITIPITLAGQQWTWSVNYTSWSMPPLPNWSTTWPSPPLHLDDGNPIIFVPIAIAEAEPTISVAITSATVLTPAAPSCLCLTRVQRPVCPQQRESERWQETQSERGAGGRLQEASPTVVRTTFYSKWNGNLSEEFWQSSDMKIIILRYWLICKEAWVDEGD